MYKFKSIKDPQNRFDNTEIEMTVDTVTVSELAEAFYLFMVGAGFHPASVLSGFKSVVEIHEEIEDDFEE